MGISSPPNYGSPDWQRGFYSAQKLLATVPTGTLSVNVTVPPNAQTLIVVLPGALATASVAANGVTTGMGYAVTRVARSRNVGGSGTYFVDCASDVDAQIQIAISVSPAGNWYVYADAAAHLVADVTKLVDSQGQQFTVPVAPGATTNDHPTNELKIASTLDSPNGTALVPAPGTGNRLRVFDAFINSATPTNFVALRTSATAVQIIGISSNNASTDARISGLPSGIPMPTNEGINIIASAGNADGTVVYSVETV